MININSFRPLFCSLLILMFSVEIVASDTNGTSTATDCVLGNTIYHQPIGDQSGKIVLTSKSTERECTDKTTIKGECLEWNTTVDEATVGKLADVAKIQSISSGNIGDALAIIGAVSQSSHMFNGVKGRCIKGTQTDFSWLEDPAFWASVAMQYLGSTNSGPPVEEGASTGSTASSAASSASTASDLYKTYGDYALCMLQGTADMLSSAKEMWDSDSECDPVDEFCGPDDGSINADPGLVQTLSMAEYNELLSKDATIVNSIELIDDGAASGYVTFRIKDTLASITGGDETEAQIAEARKKAKEEQLKIKTAVAAAKTAICLGGAAIKEKGGATGGGGGATGGDPAMAAASALTSLLPFPYNTIGSFLLKFFQSFTPVDSCGDEDDANTQGKRHVIAYRGLRFNTCHEMVNETVIEEWPATGDPMLTERRMCCFDAPMSKILMTQMHAQVGRGWAHCTGITLNELAHISWSQCTSQQMTNGFDGAKIRGVEGADYDMKNSFQFKNQCMDLTEFKAYIQSQIPATYDDTQVHEMLQQMTKDLVETVQ